MMPGVRAVVTGAFALIIGLQAAGAAQKPITARNQLTAGDVFRKASPAVVTIWTPGGFGCGLLVDAIGVLVTNLHVVHAGRSAAVDRPEDEQIVPHVAAGHTALLRGVVRS